jgi:hypothetical protein
MKINTPALSLSSLLIGVLLSQPVHSALDADQTSNTPSESSSRDARLQHPQPAETFSGSVEMISPTMSSFVLWVKGSKLELPIAVDPDQQGLFLSGSVKRGDWATVSVTSRSSASGMYSQYVLQTIHVDFAGPGHSASAQPLPDFSKAIALLLTPQPQASGLGLSATTELRLQSPR